MKKNWTLEEIAMRSIDVFSKDIAVKQAREELEDGYRTWRHENLGEGMDWPTDWRVHFESGSNSWEAMMGSTAEKFAALKESITARRNARKRLNHAITQFLTKP